MFDFIQNGAFVAVIAQGLIGASLVWDKVLLKHPGTKNLYSYVFWLGSLSVFGVALVPFGYNSPPAAVILIAFFTGVLHLVGVFFYYAALKSGEASETLAIMGGFSPVATALIALALLTRQMTDAQLLGFALMSAGGFVMFLSEKPPLKKLLPPVLLAAGFLGLVNVLEKVVYNQTNFVSGYVWFTIGTFAGSLILLVPTSWRKQIFAESRQDEPRNRFWYFVNRLMAGVGSFLIFYAISLTHPALVDAISGVRYGVIFIGALLLTQFKPQWLKEDFSGWQLISKTAGVCLVGAGLVLVGIKSGSSTVAGPVDSSCKPRHHSLGQAHAMDPCGQYPGREIKNPCLSDAGNKDAYRLDTTVDNPRLLGGAQGAGNLDGQVEQDAHGPGRSPPFVGAVRGAVQTCGRRAARMPARPTSPLIPGDCRLAAAD